MDDLFNDRLEPTASITGLRELPQRELNAHPARRRTPPPPGEDSGAEEEDFETPPHQVDSLA